jgi:hypothetical protein
VTCYWRWTLDETPLMVDVGLVGGGSLVAETMARIRTLREMQTG